MPKRTTNISRQVQHQEGPGERPIGDSISHARKPVVLQSEQLHAGIHTEEEEIEDMDGEGEDDSMAEMLTMLREIQKRKASKTSVRTAAFQNQKAALFSDARKRVDKAVRDGASAVDEARTTILGLRSQEVHQEGALASFKALWEVQDDCVQSLLHDLSGMIENLAHRRAEQINEASATLEAHIAERESSRKRLLAQASVCIEENIENQKIATDASALIKHYKALLRS
ncbi:hypothetical protein BC628DRAFT_638191 [Trametes gibbosa]|nr:hypothetical protein BC628DRAFT_638191 [Trametes gibbosa]